MMGWTGALLLLISTGAWAADMDSRTQEVPGQGDSFEASRHPASSDNLNKLKEAISGKDEGAILDAAVKVLGEDEHSLQGLNALAVHYFNQGKAGLAKILLQRALKDHADEPALHNNMAVIYLSEDKQRQAIASFRKALELKPGYTFASGNLGAIYLEYKDYKRAAEVLDAAYGSVKSDVRRGGYPLDVANNFAVALTESGDVEKAKDVFEQIMKYDESNPNTMYAYAVLLVAKMKNKEEGEKVVAKLKLLAGEGMSKKIDNLEKLLSGT